MGGTWDLRLRMPDDWVPLPLEPAVDVTAWSTEQADRLSRGDASTDHGRLAPHLRDLAVDSRLRDPVYAFAFLPDGIDTAIAVLEVDVIHPDDTVPEITLDWISETFSADDLGPPEVLRAVLPAGRTVRIRQNVAGKAADSGGGRPLVETVVYGIRPAEIDSAVIILASWTTPGIAEHLLGGTDAIASSVRVRPR